MRQVQAELGTPDEELGLSGAMFDLGVSSPQLDESGRGFSYRTDAPLDMRMDPTAGQSAADVVNEYDEDSLVSLFAANGEGRFARRIAHAIVGARPIRTTGELSDVVRAAVPAAARRAGHPARRVFQAIRIEVNEELEQVEVGVEQALSLLRLGGRCVVISYHSGEDRLVKSAFTRAATGNCQCPPGLPCVCGADPQYRLLFRGARRPTGAEVERNRRAEAARLRVVERVGGLAVRVANRRRGGVTPPAAGTARPSPTRGAPRQSPTAARRATLRVVEPSSRPRRRRFRKRPATWVSVALVAGSLFAVVAGDDLVTQGQIRLSTLQSQLASATAQQKSEQVAVAQLAAPTRVVRMAETEDGLVTTPSVIDLPEVPLDVPLPAPQTGPPASPSRR